MVDNSPMSVKGRWLRRILYGLLTLVVLFFVVRALGDRVREIPWNQLKFDVPFLFLAAGCFIANSLCTGLSTHASLKAFGCNLGWTRPVAVSWAASLGRYVPGKFAATAMALSVLVKLGVRLPVALAASLLPVALSVIIGFIVSAPLLFLSPVLTQRVPAGWFWCALIVVAGAVSLHPRVFIGLVNMVLVRLRRPPIKNRPANGPMFQLMGLIVLRFLFLGIGTWAIARTLTHVAVSEIPFFTAAAVCGSVIGLLAFFAPAGIGVREGIYLALFEPVVGPTVVVLVVLHRLAQVITDVLTGTVGLLALRKTLSDNRREVLTWRNL